MLLDRISQITQRWFLSEEALFTIFCTHRLAENSTMQCHVRVGKGIIEVNPILCEDITDRELDERLRIEVVRILLKHPYERQPEGCCTTARALGSNCVISDNYLLETLQIDSCHDFDLPTGCHFEYYARQIQRLLQQQEREEADGQDGESSTAPGLAGQYDYMPSSDERDKLHDIAANWQEDELLSATVNQAIRNIQQWGSIHGSLREEILASTKARIDYRKVLASFRATVLSQARKLTRMRPNRRSGFDAMGSRYDFTTSLLIGVDVSGSINSEALQDFYSTINRFFQYGIQQIDVVQFDTELGEVESITKARPEVTVTGRGGTDFQPFIDYLASNPHYDGALIYTDGFAPEPTIPRTFCTPLCWVLRSEEELRTHKEWMSHSGRVCVIEK